MSKTQDSSKNLSVIINTCADIFSNLCTTEESKQKIKSYSKTLNNICARELSTGNYTNTSGNVELQQTSKNELDEMLTSFCESFFPKSEKKQVPDKISDPKNDTCEYGYPYVYPQSTTQKNEQVPNTTPESKNETLKNKYPYTFSRLNIYENNELDETKMKQDAIRASVLSKIKHNLKTWCHDRDVYYDEIENLQDILNGLTNGKQDVNFYERYKVLDTQLYVVSGNTEKYNQTLIHNNQIVKENAKVCLKELYKIEPCLTPDHIVILKSWLTTKNLW